MRYSVDASSLIEGFRRIFPYEIVGTFWNRDLPSLIESGDLRATEVIRWELEAEDDEVLGFVKEFRDLFVPIDEPIQHEVRRILDEFPTLLHAGRSGGDPWVIALARLEAGLSSARNAVSRPSRASPTSATLSGSRASLYSNSFANKDGRTRYEISADKTIEVDVVTGRLQLLCKLESPTVSAHRNVSEAMNV